MDPPPSNSDYRGKLGTILGSLQSSYTPLTPLLQGGGVLLRYRALLFCCCCRYWCCVTYVSGSSLLLTEKSAHLRYMFQESCFMSFVGCCSLGACNLRVQLPHGEVHLTFGHASCYYFFQSPCRVYLPSSALNLKQMFQAPNLEFDV